MSMCAVCFFDGRSLTDERDDLQKRVEKLEALLRIEFLRHRHDVSGMPWKCVEENCPRFDLSPYLTGCECLAEYERKHIATVKKELGI